MNNSIFLLLDENNTILKSSLSFEFLVYDYLSSLETTPKLFKFEPDSGNTVSVIFNGFNTNFSDVNVDTTSIGNLIIDQNNYKIVVYDNQNDVVEYTEESGN